MLRKPITTLLAIACIFTISACSETKQVKIEQKIASTPIPQVAEAEEDIKVNVNLQQPSQQAQITKDTTNVIVKDDSAKEVAVMNANIQKLHNQLATANAQAKAEIQKQIQQMNADKSKLQQQILDLQNQNRIAQEQMRKAEAQKIANENLSVTKEQYKDTVNTKLENIDSKITQLRDKLNASNLNDSDKIKVEDEIKKLEDKKSEIETKVGAIDLASNIDSFKNTRNQIDSMFSSLDKSYNNLISSRVTLR